MKVGDATKGSGMAIDDEKRWSDAVTLEEWLAARAEPVVEIVEVHGRRTTST